jgi:hypothetical protein
MNRVAAQHLSLAAHAGAAPGAVGEPHTGGIDRPRAAVGCARGLGRFADAHIWASAPYDEVVPLGYAGSYVSFARQLRLAGLRPHCEALS